jgi:glycosyltransferase involved in cell wall biosynthesis
VLHKSLVCDIEKMNNRALHKLGPTRTKKSRILVLTTSYPSDDQDPSGIFIAKLLGAIKDRGYSIKVVAPSNGSFYGRRCLHGIDMVRFGYFRPRSLEKLTRGAGGIPENMAESLLARLQIFPMMIAFLYVALREVRDSDAVYANWLGAGIIGALVNLFTRKPLLVSFRGDDGYLARDRFFWRVLTKWVTRRSTCVAPVSAELMRIMLNLGLPKAKCHLPQFGVDTAMFHPPRGLRPAGDEVRLLFVGSLIPRKGLHDLLEALGDPRLRQVRLIVVGEGALAPRLTALCESLGLKEQTEWLGTVPPAEVARLMRSSDLLCLPSYMEGRPNVVNEAMASALPVIATRIGGIPDMVEEGKTAFLHDPGNVEELRGHIRKLVEDAELRNKMGQAGHDFLIKSGVSWDSTAEEFDLLFSRLMKQG